MKNDLLISAEKIMDCLNDGVYVCDRDRRIVYWSKSAERITGWRSEDVLGRACLESSKRWVLIAAEGSVPGWILDASEFLGFLMRGIARPAA